MSSGTHLVAPADLRTGDVITYAARDPIYLDWRPAGTWVVTSDNHDRTTLIDVNDEGVAVEVPALLIQCTSAVTQRQESKPFPVERPVEVLERGTT